jgi:hypothetical protein
LIEMRIGVLPRAPIPSPLMMLNEPIYRPGVGDSRRVWIKM